MKTENMTFSEALEAMKRGYKVRNTEFFGTDFYWFIKNDMVFDSDGYEIHRVPIGYINAPWEIYNEPKPKPQFEIGELVMMRDNDDNDWEPVFFKAYINGLPKPYYPMYDDAYAQCAKFDKDIVFTNKPTKK